jgi:hypothetical protein
VTIALYGVDLDRFNQAGREPNIGNCQSVLYRFGRQGVLPEPGAGTPV